MSTRRGQDWQCDYGAQYFTVRDLEFRAEVARWERAGVAGLWNPRLRVLNGESLRDHLAQVAAATGSVARFVGIPRMTAPARWLADALRVSAQTRIEQLQRRSDGWRLLSAEQGWLEQRFDAVLLALPAPQVVPLLQPLAPDLAAVARGVTMRGTWAMMLRFSAPVALPLDAAFVNAGPLRWIARDSSKPGRNSAETWLLHGSAQWSEAHIDDDAAHVAQALLKAFRQLGGPEPRAWSAHRWRYAAAEPALAIVCAWNAERGLGLCGDWLADGKVEGAWLSGRALAQRILSSFPPQKPDRRLP